MRRLFLLLAFPLALFAQGQNGRAFPAVSPNQASTNIGIVPNASTCPSNVYTYLFSDQGKLVSFNDSTACAVTLPQAGSAGFINNWFTSACDSGAGTTTITPTTSTMSAWNGSTFATGALAITTGQCAFIYSDNTNYFAIKFVSGSGGSGSVVNCTTQYALFYALTTGTTATCSQNIVSDAGNDLFVGGNLIDLDGGKAAYAGTFGTSGYQAFGVEGTAPTCKSSWDLLWADSTNHVWTMCNNNGASSPVASQGYVNGGITPSSATGAITGPIEVGYVSCTQATPCASSASTLLTTGSATALYRVDVSADCTTSTSLATVSVTITYTDPSGTVQTSSIGSAAVCTTLGSASIMNFTTPFAAKNATNIQYNVTTANTPSYQARVAIFQESTN